MRLKIFYKGKYFPVINIFNCKILIYVTHNIKKYKCVFFNSYFYDEFYTITE